LGRGLLPVGPPDLIRIIVSHATSYIVSFNVLRQAVQNSPYLGPFWRKPFDAGPQKIICKQSLISVPFHQLSDFYIKRSRIEELVEQVTGQKKKIK